MENNSLIGELVDKRFKIIWQLGAGGFGAVYLAEQADMDRKVALKFVHVSASDDPELLSRFEREGRIISGLDHKNIVRCYAYGLWRNKVPYLALEYLEGKTLRQLLQESNSIPWQKAFEYGIEICNALTELHRNNIVHRDLKPENLIVTSNDTLKLIDFGLVSIDGQKLTKTGTVVGSLLYLSPEQACGAPTDATSDLYSLGCVLYQLISGKPPFNSPVPLEILRLHASEAPAELRETLPDLPKGVDRILMHALQKDSSKRYSSAAEFADDMQALLQNETLISAPLVVASVSMAPSKFRAVSVAIVSAALVIALVTMCAVYYQSKLALQAEVDRLSASISDELQKSGLSEHSPYGRNYQFIGFEDLKDQSQLLEVTRAACKLEPLRQKESDSRVAKSSERYAHLDKAIALAANASVSNDDRAAVLLAESHSWSEKYLSTKEALRWIDATQTVLEKPIQRASLRHSLQSAYEDLLLHFQSAVFSGITHILYDPIQNPLREPQMFPEARRLETLLLPIIVQIEPGKDPTDPRWTNALSQYAVLLAGTGRSKKAIEVLLPFAQSELISDTNKATVLQALVMAYTASGDFESAVKVFGDAERLARKVPGAPVWHADFILLLAERAKGKQRSQLALDIIDRSANIPLPSSKVAILKSLRTSIYSAQKQSAKAVAKLTTNR